MSFDFLPVPYDRSLVVDAGYMAARRHLIYGMVEVDVTRARQALQEIQAAGGPALSFTAFLVACQGRAVAAHPQVHAYPDWRGRLVSFHDVDVATLIEPQAGKVAIPHVIRAANRRSVAEISAEIRGVQARPARSPQRRWMTSLAPRLPRFTRLFTIWVVKRNPHWLKGMAGTTILTSVGMFFKGGGWGIGFVPYHTFGLTVGGISRKPREHAGGIALREVLDMTLCFDHDVVDGAPAARFARTLVDLIECASVLEEEE